MTEALILGQAVVMLVTIGSVLVATGKILARLEQANVIMADLSKLVAKLDRRIDQHDVDIAVLQSHRNNGI
jgi:hypothetical protein